MALTNAQLVHQMYIAYYQRPAEPGGLEYWVGQLEERGSWEAVAADFGNPGNTEYAALYGDKSRAEIVAELYQSAFGRAADQGEIDHWVASDHSDQYLGFAIIHGAQGNDKVTITNKILFSDLLGTELGSDEAYKELVANANVKDLLDAVTADTEVTAEYVAGVVAGEVSPIAEALAAYQAADAAQVAFLKDLASNETFLNAFNPTQKAAIVAAKTATDTDITTASSNVFTDLSNAVNAVIPSALGGSVGENTLAGIIADATKKAADDVAKAKEDLADAQGDLTPAERSALNNLTKRLDAAAAAEKNLTAAETEAGRQVGIADANLLAAGSSNKAAVVVLNATSNAYIYDTTVTLTDNEKALLKPVLDAKNAELKAAKTQETAIEAFKAALKEVDGSLTPAGTTLGAIVSAGDGAIKGNTTVGYELVAGDFSEAGVNAYLVELGDLATAEDLQKTLNEAVESFQAIASIANKNEALGEAVEDAEEAITDSVEDGGLGVEMAAIGGLGLGNFDVVDLFVYAGKTGTLSFLEADDQIFFGDKYSFVELSASTNVATQRLGEADVLEVFYQTQGTDVVFYVEKDAESGRELSATNLVEVTLSGVTDFEVNDGFVVVA